MGGSTSKNIAQAKSLGTSVVHLTSLPLMSSKWTSTLGVWENAIPSKRNKSAVCFSISILREWSYLLRGKSSGQLCRLRQSETRVLANGCRNIPISNNVGGVKHVFEHTSV